MNFTYSNWEKFCRRVSKAHVIRGKEIRGNSVSSWLVIKHDVEAKPRKALELAKIERKYGIKSTYYIQGNLVERDADTLKAIAALGHEVTYHYDVLDANKGNMESALEEFRRYINEFNKIGLDVVSVCPHGNPLLNRWGWTSNRDFFNDESIRKLFPNIFDIVLDTPLVVGNEYIYISDAGYGFKRIRDIASGRMQEPFESDSIPTLDELLLLIECNDKVIISIHPHRWFKSIFYFKLRRFLFKNMRKAVGYFVRFQIIKKILSPMYHLARRL